MVCVSDLQGVCLREDECEVRQYVYRFSGCDVVKEEVKGMKEEVKEEVKEVNNTSENGNDIECSFSIAVEEEEDTEVVLTLLVGAVEGGEA